VELPEKTEQTIAVPAVKKTESAAGVPARRYRRVLIYLFAAALLLLAGAGLFALKPRPTRPATLQIAGNYPFRSGQIYIWVDDDLRYHDELHGPSSPHAQVSRAAAGGTIALTLPVRSGRHTVRVQVDAQGQTFDHDTAIPGYFRPFSQKTLLVDFSSRNLRWER
jgi:hypothetical protein